MILDSTMVSNKIPKVHFSWSYGARFGGPAPGMKKAIEQSGYDENEFDILAFFGFPSQPYPYRRRGAVTLRAGLDVDVSPNWRSGVHFSKSTPLEMVGSSGVSETVHRSSWEFMMTWVKRPYKKGFTRRTEWAASMGMSLNTLTARTNVPVFDMNYSQYVNTGVTAAGNFKKIRPGVVLRGSYDRYYTKNLSLHCAIESRIMPSLKVGQTGTFRPLKAHALNFSSIDASIGLRLHL